MAGDAIASRWLCVILGGSNPCVVDCISNNDDACGASVPIPALPVEGNVFVCAFVFCNDKKMIDAIKNNPGKKYFVFIKESFGNE